MRIVHSDEIIGAVEALCIQACRQLPEDVACAMHCAADQEPFAPARMILSQLVENAETAAQNEMPICQDTGMAWVMVELGQEVHLEGMLLKDAVDEGVRRGYTKGYLRKSVVWHKAGQSKPRQIRCVGKQCWHQHSTPAGRS